MSLDMSKATIAIVGVDSLEADKIRAVLCADAGAARDLVLIEDDVAAFQMQLEDRSFDVVILGFRGREADDLERLRQISAAAPATAIIVSKDREDTIMASAALAAGAQDTIVNRFFNGMSLTKALVHGVDRARMRAQLKAANQRLVRLNEEMNRFLGMAAHDLRGPIGAIGGLADLILDDSRDHLDPSSLEALETIVRSSKSMVRLIADLLDVSRIESGRHVLQLSRIDLKAFIAQSVRQNARAARQKDIALDATCPEGIAFTADADKLTQIMDNLISNAVKFSPRGTKVTIDGGTKERRVEIRVRDSGPGISDDEIKQLFSPFFRGAARPTGGEQSTGLGLPIVKGLVTEHKGQVGVTSVSGSGATFWFTLPQDLSTQ